MTRQIVRRLRELDDRADRELARAAYHVAINHGVHSVVDGYLSSRPEANRAWESYTAAQQEVSQSKGIGAILERSLEERLLSSGEPQGGA
jgi:hypothetical protein